jgi:hypothetical protein
MIKSGRRTVGMVRNRIIVGTMRVVAAKSTRLAAFCVVLAAALLSFAGRALVIDNARPSDLAIVLGGDVGDVRLQRALDLLRAGYVHDVVLDESDWLMFGQPVFKHAEDYVQTLPPDVRVHVHVCPFSVDSTAAEFLTIWQCAKASAPRATRVLLVTSSFHTRRALSVAGRLFPQCSWSVAAATDHRFDVEWWREREWAKTCLTEWQKLLWWELAERWRMKPLN